ncbi:GNAT family N-acetyltransferase [Dietzia aerolata]|uniref:GNAT family N-acetyltransferase n=1 Tax=Dietzia aerolata TaxID=595984 RepID=A0ABV5JU48_9ACTN
MRSRHVSVVIGRPPAEVYRFAADPAHLPVWAAGLASGEATVHGEELTVDSPMGRVTVRFVARNDLGVLDHEVTLPDGTIVHNPLRVLPHPEGSEVLFTIRQLDATEADFERDAAMVLADLRRLRTVLEASRESVGTEPADAALPAGAFSAPPSPDAAPHLRIATPDDALAVAGLLHAFNTEFGSPGPDPVDAAPRIARIVAGAGGFVAVASEGICDDDDAAVAVPGSGVDMGFALVTYRVTPYWDGPLAQLDELYVRRDRRSSGVGAALLARAVAEARAHGAVEMHINVDADDVDARRFYRREGFSDIDPDSGSTMHCYLRQL